MVDERFEPVLAEMRRQVDAGIRPSLQVCVEWGGERVVDAAYGAGATRRSAYALFSSTKPFVAVALLRQIEAGRASLDDRISKYVPEFGTRGKDGATLAHLLSHRGGFPDNTPEHAREMWRRCSDWSAMLAYACDMPAAWEPGTDRGYHPLTGWTLVGELVQRTTERPLREVLRRDVLDPLEIPEDGFVLGEPEKLGAPPMPVRTRGLPGDPPERDAERWNDPATQRALLPGGGGIARAGEVVKLYTALLRGGLGAGGRLLAPETVRLASFPHVVGIRDRTFLLDIPWGLGFHLKHVRPSLDDCGATATPGTYGHAGHFLVNTTWADPGKNLAACILANGLTDRRDGFAAVRALSQAVHDVVDRLAAE
jgi:CubicO group peptidase (beta-lactamase class C family)